MARQWRTTGQAVPTLSAFDDVVKAYMTQNGVRNGALAVTRGARLVLARGYTWAEPNEETTTPTSLFRLASCTKPLTSIAIYQLQEAGALQLTDNVQGILALTAPDGSALPSSPVPSNPANTPGFYFGAVQVQHLLQHAGGWDRVAVGEPTYFCDAKIAAAFNKELPVTRNEMARWGATQQMQFYPGSRPPYQNYSNFGFNLLGLVIERRRGRDYVAALQQWLFDPLAIRRARLTLPLERSRAPGEVAYYPQNPRLSDDLTGGGGQVPIQYGGENNANFASFGGLMMSAPDYARILAAYSAANPPTTILPRNMLGWFRATRGGVGCSEHGGMLPGSGTNITLRDDGIAIVALFNYDPVTFTWNGSTRGREDVLNETATAIPAANWPTHDLFPSVMTAPLLPGPEKLHVFATGTDTRIRDAAWEGNVGVGWLGWWGVREGLAQSGSPVTAVSRDPGKLDAFVVGTDSRIYTAAWEVGRAVERWRGWWSIQNGEAPLGSRVTAVSRSPAKLDVFVVGTDGFVYTAAWDAAVAGGWRGWWRIGNLVAKPGTPVAAVARDPNKLDVFVAGSDGKTYTAAWDAAVAGGWRGWWNILSGWIPPGGTVSAVSRSPSKLDVFLTSNDGGVYTAAWDAAVAGGWKGWWRIGDLVAKPGATLGALSRKLS
jgi:CubicO group peptidase (beta-lactamase class C family)